MAATWPGARALWRATGRTDDDFDKAIIAIASSFAQFVPGRVHLKDMGHHGMLYSLPSRELIADSVEHMVNAHCADASCASATATRSRRAC